MVQTYKDTPSYRQYLNVDPVTGRGERPDDLMPHLQYNEVRRHSYLLVLEDALRLKKIAVHRTAN